MKVSLFALITCFALAGTAVALQDDPGTHPPQLLPADDPGTHPPQLAPADDPGTHPPQVRALVV